MKRLIEEWKGRAEQLKVDAYALYLAYRDPRVPWVARVFAACVAGYFCAVKLPVLFTGEKYEKIPALTLMSKSGDFLLKADQIRR